MLDWLLEVIKQNNEMCPTTEAYTDVVELCALLQCLGFSVKSLNTSDGNMSHEGGARTVVINCQASGLHVVLESASSSCSCPPEASQHNSGVWHVSGIAGGQRLDKEFGCSILGALPRAHRERLTKELHTMMRCIRESSESDTEKSKEKANKSASMVEIKVSPETRPGLLKADTPTRYRSLDTLTAAKEVDQQLPTPGLLQKKLILTDNSTDDVTENKKLMCRRQSTYTLSPPGSVKIRNKTSSPLQQPRGVVLENLIAAEKAAEELRHKLATIIKQLADDEGKDDSSMSSLALDFSKISVLKNTAVRTLLFGGRLTGKTVVTVRTDSARGPTIITQFADDGGKDDSKIPSLALEVSKISMLKGSEPMKAQFASSPSLSGLGVVYEDMKKNKLKRIESASPSLMPKEAPNRDGGVASKLRRISPNFFKSRNSLTIKNDKLKPQDKNSKLNNIFKPKAVTPKLKSESSPNLSASKKKFSHIKSTIPRPTPRKEL